MSQCHNVTKFLYPWRLEDVDDEGRDKDDEAVDDGNHHALVSAQQNRRSDVARLKQRLLYGGLYLVIAENAEQDS